MKPSDYEIDFFNWTPLPRLSMSQVTTYRWSFDEDIRRYVAAGYDSIGVLRQKLSDYGEDKGVDLLAEAGLRVSSLLWAGGFTGSDGRTFQEALEDAHHAIRLAGAMNAHCLVVYAGGRNNHILPHAERLFRIALENLLCFAEAAEVVLAIEPMHPACARDWTFLTDVESVVSLIEAINSPNLKLVLDTYHFGHDQALVSNLREFLPHIALVQLGDRRVAHSIDAHRCPLGEGVIPLRAILSELAAAGYNGPFDVELAGAEFGPAKYQQILVESRSRWEHFMPEMSKSPL